MSPMEAYLSTPSSGEADEEDIYHSAISMSAGWPRENRGVSGTRRESRAPSRAASNASSHKSAFSQCSDAQFQGPPRRGRKRVASFDVRSRDTFNNS